MIERNIVEKIINISERMKKIWEKEIFSKFWITVLQFNIMWVISWEKITKLSEIKKRLVLSPASLSQAIERLEKIWLLERIHSKKDRREVHVQLLPKWDKIVKESFDIYNKMIQDTFWEIDTTKKENLLELLNILDSYIKL